MIKAVIADFDGTLCDTRHAISATLLETFRSLGKPPPSSEAISATLARGITLEETFAALAPELSDRPDECQMWVKVYREIYNGGLGVRSTTAFPGAAAALARLASLGVPVVIVSNKGQRAVEGTLRHLELEGQVHAVIAASGVLATKPDARSYAERIAPLFPELEPAELLVVGDTSVDVQYARAIGAQSGWVSFGYGGGEECRSLEPDYIFDSLPAVAELVESSRDVLVIGRRDAGVTILDHIGRQGPASPAATYLRAFRQADIPRDRAQRMVAHMTRHVLAARGAAAPPDVLVPIARAGLAMWPTANELLGHPASCFAVARKDKATSSVEVQLSSGLHGGEARILILDTVSATGDTIIATAALLHARCPESRIEVASCYASPEAVDAIARSPFVERLVVGTLSLGVEAGWLLPRTNGDVGDKLFGARGAGAR